MQTRGRLLNGVALAALTEREAQRGGLRTAAESERCSAEILFSALERVSPSAGYSNRRLRPFSFWLLQ